MQEDLSAKIHFSRKPPFWKKAVFSNPQSDKRSFLHSPPTKYHRKDTFGTHKTHEIARPKKSHNLSRWTFYTSIWTLVNFRNNRYIIDCEKSASWQIMWFCGMAAYINDPITNIPFIYTCNKPHLDKLWSNIVLIYNINIVRLICVYAHFHDKLNRVLMISM